MKRGVIAALMLAGMACGLCGCYGFRMREGLYIPDDRQAGYIRENRKAEHFEAVFKPEAREVAQAFASPQAVENFSGDVQQVYRLGPGDRFAFIVRRHPEISREEIIVSPDGEVALPRVGILNVAGKTLAELTELINQRLSLYYDEPDATLIMTHFNNNKVYVLGRVANPGTVHFSGRGTLLEALSLAGGLPVDTAKSYLTRCMIVRGKDMVIWIDLKELLENGNMALNPTLKNGDVVFIPQSEDQVAYVMGMVQAPGVLHLRSAMTVMDALMYSGGLARDADATKVFLVRQHEGKGLVEHIDVAAMVERGDMRTNYLLKDGDILYVDERGTSKFNYYLSKLMPSMDVVDFSIRTAESFGAMAELRRKIWGQEGFVTPVR